MATTIDVCKQAPHEWRNGELFVTLDQRDRDIGWLETGSVQKIKKLVPKAVAQSDHKFPFFAIDRDPSGDKVFEVDDCITMEGGAAMCFLKPIGQDRLS